MRLSNKHRVEGGSLVNHPQWARELQLRTSGTPARAFDDDIAAADPEDFTDDKATCWKAKADWSFDPVRGVERGKSRVYLAQGKDCHSMTPVTKPLLNCHNSA